MTKKKGAATPMAVAKWFINAIDRDAGEAITHLKLQKLIYYAEAWYLVHFGKSLIGEDLQAWAHGPVCPSVYQHFKSHGFEALPVQQAEQLNPVLQGFLDAVYETYGNYSAKKLERMTHDEEPWKATRGKLAPEAKCEKPISKLLMRNYYAGRLGKKEVKAL